jgi:hypothetical protein
MFSEALKVLLPRPFSMNLEGHPHRYLVTEKAPTAIPARLCRVLIYHKRPLFIVPMFISKKKIRGLPPNTPTTIPRDSSRGVERERELEDVSLYVTYEAPVVRVVAIPVKVALPALVLDLHSSSVVIQMYKLNEDSLPRL